MTSRDASLPGSRRKSQTAYGADATNADALDILRDRYELTGGVHRGGELAEQKREEDAFERAR